MTPPERTSPTTLTRQLRKRIQQEGPIGVDTFMRVALQDPEQGYYTRKNPIGRSGDFITSPEISQMFGELISMWIADIWLRAGRPSPVRVVELGPGRGTMMTDILRAACSVAGFREALHPVLVETGRTLAARQKRTLGGAGARWVNSVDDVPDGPAFWLANEFFDALPIRQFVRARDEWRERCLGIGSSGFLTWEPGAIARLPAPLNRAVAGAKEGATVEWSPDSEQMLRRIAQRVAEAGGVALVIDYGYQEAELARAGGCDTLQAVRNHCPAAILEEIGNTDLSAHVNFSALSRVAAGEGVLASPVVPQGQFLKSLGLDQRAEALSRRQSGSARAAIEEARKRLTDRDGMGSLFRVFAFRAPYWPEPAGFETAGASWSGP